MKQYWDHWQKYGQVHHPATEQKKHIPVGMAGDDAKYTLAGAKIICMLLNFPLQQVMRVMAEPVVFTVGIRCLCLFVSLSLKQKTISVFYI